MRNTLFSRFSQNDLDQKGLDENAEVKYSPPPPLYSCP